MAPLAVWFLSIFNAASSFLPQPLSTFHKHQPLRFTPEGEFQLAIFNDLHFGEGKLH